jgi:YndJ-like protein
MIHLVLAWALVGAVPLAVGLAGWVPVSGVRLALLGTASASLTFLFRPEGLYAGVAALVWLLICVVIAIKTVSARPALLRVVPVAYLVVGAGWLVLARFGARPMDLSDEIVRLTAVHFHYAGFIAPVLVDVLREWLEQHQPSRARTAQAALFAVLIATPLTAAGISFAPVLGAMGALAFAGGLTIASVVTLRVVVRRITGVAAALLAMSALSVIGAMVLAVSYAFGQWLGTPAPSLPVMAMTHGLANAFGFATAGALGWILVERASSPNTPGRALRGVRRS